MDRTAGCCPLLDMDVAASCQTGRHVRTAMYLGVKEGFGDCMTLTSSQHPSLRLQRPVQDHIGRLVILASMLRARGTWK